MEKSNKKIYHVRGLYKDYSPAKHIDAIYFAEDVGKIIFDGKEYGTGGDDKLDLVTESALKTLDEDTGVLILQCYLDSGFYDYHNSIYIKGKKGETFNYTSDKISEMTMKEVEAIYITKKDISGKFRGIYEPVIHKIVVSTIG